MEILIITLIKENKSPITKTYLRDHEILCFSVQLLVSFIGIPNLVDGLYMVLCFGNILKLDKYLVTSPRSMNIKN